MRSCPARRFELALKSAPSEGMGGQGCAVRWAHHQLTRRGLDGTPLVFARCPHLDALIAGQQLAERERVGGDALDAAAVRALLEGDAVLVPLDRLGRTNVDTQHDSPARLGMHLPYTRAVVRQVRRNSLIKEGRG